jgi:quinol-cytochrome oxidoreductase complex cytochrome b subunit
LWGGYSVDNPTLTRFFSLHYLLPFLILGFVLLHLTILHRSGSTVPIVRSATVDRINFYPYFYVKDLLVLLVALLLLTFLIGYYPTLLGDSDNEIMANSWVTPHHIVPEWYFLRAPFRLLIAYCLYRAVSLVYIGYKTTDLSDPERVGECSMSVKGYTRACRGLDEVVRVNVNMNDRKIAGKSYRP